MNELKAWDSDQLPEIKDGYDASKIILAALFLSDSKLREDQVRVGAALINLGVELVRSSNESKRRY